jgi:hypothetical protein
METGKRKLLLVGTQEYEDLDEIIYRYGTFVEIKVAHASGRHITPMIDYCKEIVLFRAFRPVDKTQVDIL